MTSAGPVPARGYSSLGQIPPSVRSSQPMPAPLSRIALAAKQNQIIALQALQAAAASASASSSSSSSSIGGSPPPSSSYVKSSDGVVIAVGAKRGRKFQAYRAPSLVKASPAVVASSSSETSASQLVPLITTSVPHWSAEGSHPLFDPSSGRRSEIYSLTNDRYPGAPGTALAKAREAQQKALQAAKREAAKKLASKAELEHLGVKGLGKKRKSSSPYATVGGAIQVAASSGSSRATQEQAASQVMSRDSSRGRNAVKPPADNNNLTVPSTSRSRRPASRASSPAPITAAAQSSLARRAGTRSGSVAPADEESGSAGASTGRRISPSRGTSPPDDSKKNNHHGLASTAPFQSSPLAASAITMEPLLDTDEVADQSDSKTRVPEVEISPSAAAKSASAKRKASALSQEVSLNDEEPESAPVSNSLDEVSKRLKRDTADDVAAAATAAADAVERTVKEGSPSSVSSSRRTSPRMSSRHVASAA